MGLEALAAWAEGTVGADPPDVAGMLAYGTA